MVRRIVLLARARRDLEAIHEYTVAEWSAEQAERYLTALREALDRLLLFPELGARIPGASSARIWNVERHRIVYRATPSAIKVLRVLHQAQQRSRIRPR